MDLVLAPCYYQDWHISDDASQLHILSQIHPHALLPWRGRTVVWIVGNTRCSHQFLWSDCLIHYEEYPIYPCPRAWSPCSLGQDSGRSCRLRRSHHYTYSTIRNTQIMTNKQIKLPAYMSILPYGIVNMSRSDDWRNVFPTLGAFHAPSFAGHSSRPTGTKAHATTYQDVRTHYIWIR